MILLWSRSVVKPRPGDVIGARLRVLPLSWFYQEDRPFKPRQPAPKLIVGLPGRKGVEVPSLYCDERFFVKLSDVAKALHMKISRDIYSTVHQNVTCLGYRLAYDRTHLRDPVNADSVSPTSDGGYRGEVESEIPFP